MNEEEVVNAAMQIILYAGDARTYINEALEELMEEHQEKADEKILLAEESIKNAHMNQTQIIQGEASGIKVPYSMLFTHAQDTLMTIYSEYHIARQLIVMYRKLSNKIERI